MPKKERRNNRDHYVLTFKDENYDTEWKVGNLSRFLRSIFECNAIIRAAYPKFRSADQFGAMMRLRMCNALYYNRERHNTNKAKFYLMPPEHARREDYTGIIVRKDPKFIKGLQQ